MSESRRLTVNTGRTTFSAGEGRLCIVPSGSRLRHHAVALAGGAVLLTALGCGNPISPERSLPPTDAAHLYWTLTLSHHAITLSTVAPYDTLHVSVTPRDANGGALPLTGVVTFFSSDARSVRVDSSGLLRAIAPSPGVPVIATLTTGNQILVDTAIVIITADSAPAPITNLSIHPIPPDSATMALGFLFNNLSLPLRATDASGSPVTGIAMAVTSSDTTVAQICGVNPDVVQVCAAGLGTNGHPGRVRVIATTTTYGVTVADTVVVTVTMPLFTWVELKSHSVAIGSAVTPSFGPSSITVAPGATVLWINAGIIGSPRQQVDVTFDDSANVVAADTTYLNCHVLGFPATGSGTGNIAAFGDTSTTTVSAQGCRARRFNVASTYHYHSVLTGATGTVVVTTGISK